MSLGKKYTRKPKVSKKKKEKIAPDFDAFTGTPMYYTGVQQVEVPAGGDPSDVINGVSGGLALGTKAAQFAPDPYSKAALMAAGAGAGLYKGIRDREYL
jgi:hypothetical protein